MRTVPSANRTARAEQDLIEQIGGLAYPLSDDAGLDPLIDRIGNARYVLLGEASHGTSEYYVWRHRISERLIREKGFSFIAVEGDWPDCYRVNRYVQGYDGSGGTAEEVARGFERWPTWMWANREIVSLIEFLHDHNGKLPEKQRVGFFGLDVYSLWDSLHAVIDYARAHRPDALPNAAEAFRCFEPYEDVQEYARAAAWYPQSCEDEVVRMLAELRRRTPEFPDDREAAFNAEQNALVAKNAEHYYRIMGRGDRESWNVRDRHMVETLERLVQHHGPRARAIVWEHNTHIGDARATDMAAAGIVNVGQLVREEHARDDVVIVGFGSYRGSVIAGRAWDAPMQRMPVPPAREGSWEDVFHRAGQRDRMLIFDEGMRSDLWRRRRGHRAIGVVYHPQLERHGNYVPTVLPDRYDAFLYLDETEALDPLHVPPDFEREEVPETFPTGV
jgi:erythromycin esterase-like protein